MEDQKVNCQSCHEVLPDLEKIYFCPNCSSPIKCKTCNELLPANTNFCANCGAQTKAQNNPSQPVMNEFDYEQKGNSKKIKARFTNEVGVPIAETFAAAIGINPATRRQINPFVPKGTGVATDSKVLPDKIKKPKETIEEAEIVYGDEEYNSVLLKIFSYENEKLKLINPRLKQTGKLDNAIRLSVLTLYAYELAGQSKIEKAVLIEMLAASKLEDTHFKGWILKCDEILSEGSKLELSVPGKETAKRILSEILNDSIVKGSIAFSKTSHRSKRRKKKDGESSGETELDTSSSTKKSKGPIFYLEELLKEGYFGQRRKLNDMITHLKDNKGESCKSSDLSAPLLRLIKSKKLSREKNSDHQYEYFKP